MGLKTTPRRAAHSTSQSPMLCRDRWRPASPGQLLRAGRHGGPALRQESIISGSPLIQWSRVPGRGFCSRLAERNEPFWALATLMLRELSSLVNRPVRDPHDLHHPHRSCVVVDRLHHAHGRVPGRGCGVGGQTQTARRIGLPVCVSVRIRVEESLPCRSIHGQPCRSYLPDRPPLGPVEPGCWPSSRPRVTVLTAATGRSDRRRRRRRLHHDLTRLPQRPCVTGRRSRMQARAARHRTIMIAGYRLYGYGRHGYGRRVGANDRGCTGSGDGAEASLR